MECRAQLLPDRLHGDAGLQLHQRSQPEVGRAGKRGGSLHHHGDEDIGDGPGLGSREAIRTDADNLVDAVAHPHRAANRFGVACEAARPIIVREDDHRVLTKRDVVVFG